MARPIRVLVFDDSVFARQFLAGLIARDPEIEVVGTVGDPDSAWEMIRTLAPDVLTLDIVMREMDGLVFLERLMASHPLPVVMISAVTEEKGPATLRALELGAVDFVAKPEFGTMDDVARELREKIKRAARTPVAAAAERPSAAGAPPAIGAPWGSGIVVGIGASTGGTTALRTVLERLPENGPLVLVVQHMSGSFTQPFAELLDRICPMHVKVATDGARGVPGEVLLAPEGRHLEVSRRGSEYRLRLHDGPPENHHRPSVDVLFRSIAATTGSAIGVILTGMGADGAAGLLAIRQAGGRTLAQDETTSVVFGMPKVAIAAGGVDEILLPLEEIAPRIANVAAELSAAADPGRGLRPHAMRARRSGPWRRS